MRLETRLKIIESEEYFVYCLYDMCRVTIFYLKLRIIRLRQITIISSEFLSIQTWKNDRARSRVLLLAVEGSGREDINQYIGPDIF